MYSETSVATWYSRRWQSRSPHTKVVRFLFSCFKKLIKPKWLNRFNIRHKFEFHKLDIFLKHSYAFRTVSRLNSCCFYKLLLIFHCKVNSVCFSWGEEYGIKWLINLRVIYDTHYWLHQMKLSLSLPERRNVREMYKRAQTGFGVTFRLLDFDTTWPPADWCTANLRY
jgi:hypothetical protein